MTQLSTFSQSFSGPCDYSSSNNPSPCVYKTRHCTGQMQCQYCIAAQQQSHHHDSLLSNHSSNTKPWRVAFFPEYHQQPHHHHPYYQQQRYSSKLAFSNIQHVPRRLSSGSACETCRRRKTKCDGGQPCAYCATNRIQCIHRPTKKRSHHHISKQTAVMMGWAADDAALEKTTRHRHHDSLPTTTTTTTQHKPIVKQTSCPSLKVMPWSTNIRNISPPATPPPPPAEGNITPKEAMPSVTDQLSCRTFAAVTTAAVDHPLSYPIYPLVPTTTPPSLASPVTSHGSPCSQ
ncbi:hypothetical protein O0I10_000816 [Lichtheimia ornata]|uniref:Zn(2)-C6 fungal-type domain-containing protein n=1 Tax=Lichtheimia ornata TaxID=688661 RepID=A0AAD8DJE3_9FUNG|nr:uncharacterized protein O0I10_000816 [Lichtheimia ornata]KAJ8663572.1 hypothetical protein O0I10_000816 [Lichtheimia ornata]